MDRFCKIAISLALAAVAGAQAGPNTLAEYNPGNRTGSLNSTVCILPISKDDAQAISHHPLLDVPASVLPSFPEGKHPLVLNVGYMNDIRMTAGNIVPLQIPALMQASVAVAYVDVTKDGKTPVNVPINTYIGGTNGRDLEALVPALVGSISPFEGTLIGQAEFVPDTAAVQSLGSGVYNTQIKPFLLPNPLSGPGIVGEAVDILFKLTDKSPYNAATFHNLLNRPALLTNGNCQRNILYYNETFADPKMAVANVTLYHQILDSPPSVIAGKYTDVYCYQANGEEVGAVGEPCDVSAANIDPKSRQ